LEETKLTKQKFISDSGTEKLHRDLLKPSVHHRHWHRRHQRLPNNLKSCIKETNTIAHRHEESLNHFTDIISKNRKERHEHQIGVGNLVSHPDTDIVSSAALLPNNEDCSGALASMGYGIIVPNFNSLVVRALDNSFHQCLSKLRSWKKTGR
jgi:superoxide dismutase